MKYVKNILKVILVFLLMLSIGLSIGYYYKCSDINNIANIYLENKNLSFTDFKGILNNDEDNEKKVEITGWAQKDDVEINYKGINTSANADLIEFMGDSSLLIRGNKLSENDRNGCIIDKKTCYELFRTLSYKGKEIIINDKYYTIRGIHSGRDNTVFINAPYNSSDNLNGVLVNVGKDSINYLESFSSNKGFSNSLNNNYIFYSTYSSIAYFFTMILPVIMLFSLLFLVFKKIKDNKRKVVKKALYVLLSIFIVFVFVKITKIKGSVPYDLIPKKWSDFDYFSELFKKLANKYESLLYMKKYNMDIYYINYMIKSILFSLLSIVIFFICKKIIKIENKKECFVLIPLILIMEFVSVLILGIKYNLIINYSLMYLLLPLYLLGTSRFRDFQIS